eukprot:CAMPEP_0170754850 /NCGR_PEP_ID=MMETSP0437-20130122/13214_1 /TAXON_ID=0 /ORGANISM="Sexangularia sp." /LENGTH=541 /DNA_ID=CAMNT_0011093999 /DNA_START=1 /DNA_END=1626 /DNA_ORIENTATION=-
MSSFDSLLTVYLVLIFLAQTVALIASVSAVRARRSGTDLDSSALTRRANSIATGQLMLLLVYFTPVGIVSSVVGSIVSIASTAGAIVPTTLYLYFIVMLFATLSTAFSGITLAEFDSRRNLSVGHLVIGIPIFTSMVVAVVAPAGGPEWAVAFFSFFFLVTPIWIMSAVIAESLNSTKFTDGSLTFGLDLVYAGLHLAAFLVSLGFAPDVIASSGLFSVASDPVTVVIIVSAIGVIGGLILLLYLLRQSTSLHAEYQTLSDVASPDASRLRHFSGVLVAAAEEVRHDKVQAVIGLVQGIAMFVPFVVYTGTIINDSSQSDLMVLFVATSLFVAIIGQFLSATRARARADVGLGGGRGCAKLISSLVVVTVLAALPIATIALMANGSEALVVVITLLVLMVLCLFVSPEVASWTSSDRLGGCCGPAGAGNSSCDVSPGVCGMSLTLRLHWGVCVLAVAFVMMLSYFMVLYSTFATVLFSTAVSRPGITIVLPAGFYILNLGTILIFGISAGIMNNVYNILGRDVAFTCGANPENHKQLKQVV